LMRRRSDTLEGPPVDGDVAVSGLSPIQSSGIRCRPAGQPRS
jgi:hypothetical protein